MVVNGSLKPFMAYCRSGIRWFSVIFALNGCETGLFNAESRSSKPCDIPEMFRDAD